MMACTNPHLHVRAMTREAARPQPQGSEDATGYWAADSLLPPPLPLLLPFPLHLLCLLVNLMAFPLKTLTCSYVLPSAVQWDGLSSGHAVPCSPMPRCVTQGFSGGGARMPARSVCLVTLSLSEAGPRTPRRPASVTDIYHAIPCHVVEVCEGAPVAVGGGVLTAMCSQQSASGNHIPNM